MYHIKKNLKTIIAVLATLPVLFFFQNCQPGSVSVSDNQSSKLATSGVTTDTFVVVTDDEANMVNTMPVDNPVDGGSGYVSGGKGSGHSGAPTTDPDSPKVPREPGSDDGSKGSSCKNLVISDVLLNVSSVDSFLIIDADKLISLNKPTLKIKALRSEVLKNLFVVLNADGNKVLSSQSEVLLLKTPSAQTAGLKIHLQEAVSVVAGQSYILELVINPEDQIVGNSQKCIFKPVVKIAHLKAL